MSAFVTWIRNKFGRIMTCIGAAVAGLDITPVGDQVKDLIGRHAFSAVCIVLFLVSFARHQQVANAVGKPPETNP